MIEVLFGSILTTLAISFGYYIGKKDRLPSLPVPKMITKYKEQVLASNDKKLGAFEEPSQQDIILNANPELKAEVEQMNKVFKSNEL